MDFAQIQSKLQKFSLLKVASITVAISGVILTLLSFFVSTEFINSNITQTFNLQVINIRSDITREVEVYNQFLTTFSATVAVEPDKLSELVANAEIAKNYPELEVISFVSQNSQTNEFEFVNAIELTDKVLNISLLDEGLIPEYESYLNSVTTSSKVQSINLANADDITVFQPVGNQVAIYSFNRQAMISKIVSQSNYANGIDISVSGSTGNTYFSSREIIGPYEYTDTFDIRFAGNSFKVNIFSNQEDFILYSYYSYVPVGITVIFAGTMATITLLIEVYRRTRSSSQKLARYKNQELSKLENQLRTILDNTSALITVKDIEGRYLICNRQFIDFFGKNEAEIIGKTDFNLMDEVLAEEHKQNDAVVVTGQTSFEFEERFKSSEGAEQVYVMQKSPLFDNNHNVYAIASIGTNITERRQTTEKLKNRQLELEKINEMLVNRELKMIELKEEINNLKNSNQ